jgi:hypothetical protein
LDDKLFEVLDDLDIEDTNLLLNKNINLSLDSSTRRRIEQSVKQKTGYYNETNILKKKFNNIIGGIFMKRKIALAASVALVLSLGGGGYAYAKTPVAYVSLDINPSIELGVNAFDTIVSAEAYNEDGEKVLEGTNLINTKVVKAVSTVISNAISDGYIKEDDTITTDAADTTATTSAAVEITISTDKEGVADKLNESLKEAADETLENNDVEAEVETDKVDLAKRDEARQLGITPGKLNLIQKLQTLDPTIKVEDYKYSSVKDIQKKAKELRKMNKSGETTTDSNTNTNTDTNTTTDKNTSIDTNVTSGDNTQQNGTVSQSSVDSDNDTDVVSEKNNNSSNEKSNYGSIKKEDIENKEEKTTPAYEKKNDNSQGNGNSSKSEKSNNGNSNSQGKGKGKNN